MEGGSQDFYEALPRLLQADNNKSTDAHLTQTEIIKSACTVYVGIFAVLFILFLIVRPRYPRIYDIKNSYPASAHRLHAPTVARDSFGPLSWIWKVVWNVEYDRISEECGVDAVTTIRLLELGVKLSLVGVFNSIYLIPIYAVMGDAAVASSDSGGSGETSTSSLVDDPVLACSLSNLGQGHNGTIATAVAAYIFFVSAMHFIDVDFEWFTFHRHNFLSRKSAQNYTVFLSGLPPEMRTNAAVRDYFNNCFSHDAVADVHVALVIPNLEKKVARRDKLLPTLEHASNILNVKGETPMHKTKTCGGEKVESIPAYTEEIHELNEEISGDIRRIKTLQMEREARTPRSDGETGERVGAQLFVEEIKETTAASSKVQAYLPDDNEKSPDQEGRGAKLAEFARSVKTGASSLKSLLTGEDGSPRNAGFVSFSNLASANLSRQAIHNDEPWFCVPKEPPMPDLVNWKNVGKSNTSKQIGELISFVLTALLCLFWTIPVTFVASLSNVESLTKLLPFLKAPVETYSWFSSLLALLAPLILVVFVSLLPHIILSIIKLEGLIEIETMQHPSLFAKLGFFTIIQTFFISTIASTLFHSLEDIYKNPSSAITLLAKALPAQSAYFIQIIIVQNLLALGIELLRISPIVQNIARKIVSNMFGHNLTEKERSETFLGLRSLDDPLEYYFGRELGSKVILLQMVLYVYGCMAPITSYFTLLVFGLLVIGFRHQFIFIYPPGNDSGGKLWLNFTRLSVTCMIVAEIVLCAVLLLQEGYIAAIMLVPLIVSTVLFNIYFKRRHYSIPSHLPLGNCALIDGRNEREGMRSDWLKGAYLQPALKESDAQDVEQHTTLDEDDLADDHKMKGNSYMKRKAYALALAEYNKAIEISPSGEDTNIYYSNRAAAHCYLKDYYAAADDCRASIYLNSCLQNRSSSSS